MLSKKFLLAPLAFALLSVLQVSTTAQDDAPADQVVPNQDCNTSTVHNTPLLVNFGYGATPDIAIGEAVDATLTDLLANSGVICDLCELPPPWFIRCIAVPTTPFVDMLVRVPTQLEDGTWCTVALFRGQYAVTCLSTNC